MRKLLVVPILAWLCLLAAPAPATAQYASAVVVAACGTPPATYSPGSNRALTQNTAGTLCSSTSGGGGTQAVVGPTANGSPAANPPVLIGGTGDGTGTGTVYNAKIDSAGNQYFSGAITCAPCALETGGNLAAIKTDADALVAGLSNPIPACSASPCTTTIGKVAIDQTTPGTTNAVRAISGTTGGASVDVYEPGASDNHRVIKNGAGTFYPPDTSNLSATINYVRYYDAGTGFNGCNSATGLIWEQNIPGNSTNGGGRLSAGPPPGIAFSTGLSQCVTGAYGNTNTTNATASSISINTPYK